MPVYNSIGPFQIKTILGGGGMGRVFLADNVAEGRTVALKLVPAEDDAAVAERWGAQLTQQLDHPGVVRVYSFGELEGHFFVEMEYVAGRTLRRLVQEEGIQPVARACRFARQTCDVLSAAHAYRGTIDGKSLSGIIHGDLSWSNVLIQPDDRVKIIDFGVADALSATRSWKTVKGQTPNFAAPEQLKPGEMRVESDIWAVGVLLYIMLTDRLPFNRTADKSTEERILHDRPAYPENLPAPLVAILNRTLQKSYRDRYPGADALTADLVAFSEGRPISPDTEARPSVFRLPGESPVTDDEQTQRTQRLPSEPTAATSDFIRAEIRTDAEATQRTESSAPPPRIEDQSPPQRPGSPAGPDPARAAHTHPWRGPRKFALASLFVLLSLGVLAFTYEMRMIDEARVARERFESGADPVETTWQTYESLKKRDCFKVGALRLEMALKHGLVQKGEAALSRALDPAFMPVKQDWQEAAYYFDYARRLPPNQAYSEARYDYASAMVAGSSGKKKDIARAQELLRLAAEQDRHWPYPWEALGRIDLEAAGPSKSQNYAQTTRYFSQAIELDGRWAKPYEGRGWCYLRSAPPKLDEAIHDFERALELGMNTKNLHGGLAMALEQRGNADSNILTSEMDLRRAEKEYKLAGVPFKRENTVVRILKRVFDVEDKKTMNDER